MIMKHADDDGDLSVFASRDSLLFACDKGHYWVVGAQQQALTGVESPSSDHAGASTATGEGLEELTARFGPGMTESILGIQK